MRCIADKGRVTFVHKYIPKTKKDGKEPIANENDNLRKNTIPEEGTMVYITTALHEACKNGHSYVVLYLLLG